MNDYGLDEKEAYKKSVSKVTSDMSARFPVIYRMKMMGASNTDVVKVVGGTEVEVQRDLDIIEEMQTAMLDIDKIRFDLSLHLDDLYYDIMSEIRSGNADNRPSAKAEYYRAAREVLLQKAQLYGLGMPGTINIQNNGKLVQLVQQLGALSAPESKAEASGLAIDGVYSVSATETTAVGFPE